MDSSDASTQSGLSEEEALATFSRSTVSMVLTNPALDDNPIVYVNDAFERMTGYSRAAVIGRNCRFLQTANTDPDDRRLLRGAVARGDEVTVDILNKTASGEPFTNRLLVSPVRDDSGAITHFLGIQKRLSPKEAQQARAGSGDRALREIQHRVKNHLAMIVALIRVQSRESTATAEYDNLARRVESLQLLYEEMTDPDRGLNRDGVDLGAYLTRVASAISHIDGRAGLRMNISAASIMAPVDPSTRIGLLTSEVLTNAFQHAFRGRRRGVVELRVTEHGDGGIRVTVGDDGIGIPDGVTWPDINSLGGRIVMGLIDGLGGSIDVAGGAAGTVVTLDVPGQIFKEKG